MKKLKCWKKNTKSNYPARWDKKGSSHVVVVNKVYSIKTRKPFKFGEEPSFEVMHSHATGGWQSIDIKKTKQDAIKKAFKFMEKADTC